MRPLRSIVPALLLALACGIAASAHGATTTTTVTMDVPSATSITNNCTAPSATTFGVVQAGSNATTATTAGAACAVSFSSSNDSSALRLGTQDNQGAAMTSPSAAWSTSRANGHNLRAIDRSTNLVMVGGFGGTISRSTTGGSSWTTSTAISTGDYVFDIDNAPGSDNIWVIAGGKGKLASTTNAYTSAPAAPTWTDNSAALAAAGWPASEHVEGVTVISAAVWMVVGSQGHIAKTTNTGGAWTVFAAPGGVAALKEIEAIDANTIYAVGSNSALLKTTLGGDNAGEWTVYTHPWCGCWWEDLSIADASHVYLVTNAAIVARWDGSAWASTIELPERTFITQAVSSPASASNVVYVAASNGKVMRSADSGLTWTRQDTTGSGLLMDVSAVSSSDVIAVGAADVVTGSTTSGASWTLFYEDATRRPIEDTAFNPTNGQQAVAVGGRGSILRTTDSAATWNTMTSATTANLNAVAWLTSSRIVAVGANGTAVTSSDGGTTWTARSTGSTAELIDVDYGADGRVWAAGTGGTILFSQNYGQTWTSQTSGTTNSLESISAWGTQMAVAGGMNGVLLRTANGGSSWSSVAGLPAWENATGIVATSATNVWIATRFQGLYRSTDGGATIAPLATFPAGQGVDSMDALDSTIVTLDRWGIAGISRDSGATWSTEYSFSSVDFNYIGDITLADPHTYLAVDDLGSIRQQDEASAASAIIPDYSGASNFTSGQTTGTFGVCLQSLTSATQWAGWTPDGGTCTAVDTDPWKSVPTAPATVASATSGTTGTATFVWGIAIKASQPPATYRAGIVFETVAPAA